MQRENWGSKFGFIMAAAGSAVGLGNIWRFPYVTGENGGGAFVFVYVLCVVLIGAPLLFNEMALGRITAKSPIGSIKESGGKGFWYLGAILSISVSFFVLSYYGVIAGWTIGYIYTSLMSIEMNFAEFQANMMYIIPLFVLFMGITAWIVKGGISGGIEKASKILMPVLFVLVFLVILRSVTLPGAGEGIKYYLTPDFSKINGGVVLAAIGQAFFSMSIGWGIMITYGSYLPKSENIVSSGLWVGFTDAAVALLGGLMIFPAVFAFGKAPNQGTELVFSVLPEIFNSMPAGGNIVGALFFLLLCIAALTSSISILEVPVSYLIDEKGMSRNKSTWIMTTLIFLVGIPSAMSKGGSEWLSTMQLSIFGSTYTGFLDIVDYIFGTFIIVVAALMICIYTVWIYSGTKMIGELEQGNEWFTQPLIGAASPAKIWVFFMKYVCPTVILLVLLNMIGIFGIFSGGG